MLQPRSTTRRRALVVVSQVLVDGGIQRFNRTFLAACHRLDLQCDVLSLGDTDASRTSWRAPSTAHVRVFAHNKVHFACAVVARILAGGYDYIIVGHVNLLTLVIGATRLRPPRQVVMIAHGIEVWSGLTGFRRKALRHTDLILCVSRYTRDLIQQQVPELPHQRLRIFPNALSELWSEQFATVALEPSPSLPPRYLLTVTRLDRADRYKGVTTVLEAVSMLQDSTLHYVVAGIGSDLRFLERVAERLGIGPRVHFVGAVSDAELARLYRHCVAFVLPSGKEGFGIVFLEAMYFGACVIAAREKGAVDVVQHDQTGLLIAYGDCVALRHSIDRLTGDPALRERLQAAGRSTVIGTGTFTFGAYVARLATELGVPLPSSGIQERAHEAEMSADVI